MIKGDILVSVITPTYKRSAMLTRAIESVLAQTYKNVEILVIDDNNPDTEWRATTSKLMEQYKGNEKVRYICHEKNMNGSVARNTGIHAAKGQIVTFLDDDDWYVPEKIEKQVEFLLKNPQHRCCVCGWHRNDEDVFLPPDLDVVYNYLTGKNIIITNSIMMWTEDARKCGGFDVTFRRHQEASFVLRYVRMGGTVGFIPDILVMFDMDDRGNEPNPEQNEIYTLHYLNTFTDLIEECERKKPGSKREIWFYKYRAIWVVYMKSHDYRGAWKFYLKIFKKEPFAFTWDLIKYVFWRIFLKNK